MATSEYHSAVAALRRDVIQRDKVLDGIRKEMIETTSFINGSLAAAGEDFRAKETHYTYRISIEKDMQGQLKERIKGAESEVLNYQSESRWWQEQMHAVETIVDEQAQQWAAMKQVMDRLTAEKRQLQRELEKANKELQETQAELSLLADRGRGLEAEGPSGVADSSTDGHHQVGRDNNAAASLATFPPREQTYHEGDHVAALQESLTAGNISRASSSSSSSSDHPSGPITPDPSEHASDTDSDDGSAGNTVVSVIMPQTVTQSEMAEQSPPSSSSSKPRSHRRGLLGIVRKSVSWCCKRFTRVIRR